MTCAHIQVAHCALLAMLQTLQARVNTKAVPSACVQNEGPVDCTYALRLTGTAGEECRSVLYVTS